MWYRIAAVIAVLAVLGIIEDESDPNSGWSDMITGWIEPDPQPQPTPWIQPAPPPQRPPHTGSPFSGTWYDQLSGVKVVHAYVELHQSGDTIDGDIFNMQASPVGTVSGDISGNRMTYSYDAMGQSGEGVGIMRPDGTHIDIRVTDNATGYTEQHVLHKNHQPE